MFQSDQELWTLEREEGRPTPDVVLVQFSGNDLQGNDTTFAHAMMKPRFVRDAGGAWRIENRPVAAFVPIGVAPPSASERAASRSALWQVVSGRTPLFGGAETPHPAVAARGRSPSYDPWGAESATRHAFELLQDRCRAVGASLVVFGAAPYDEPERAPLLRDGVEFLYGANSSLAALGDDVGFTTLSVDRPIRDALAAGAAVCVPDGHWNAEGHRIVAAALAPRLAEILARRPPR